MSFCNKNQAFFFSFSFSLLWLFRIQSIFAFLRFALRHFLEVSFIFRKALKVSLSLVNYIGWKSKEGWTPLTKPYQIFFFSPLSSAQDNSRVLVIVLQCCCLPLLILFITSNRWPFSECYWWCTVSIICLQIALENRILRNFQLAIDREPISKHRKNKNKIREKHNTKVLFFQTSVGKKEKRQEMFQDIWETGGFFGMFFFAFLCSWFISFSFSQVLCSAL